MACMCGGSYDLVACMCGGSHDIVACMCGGSYDLVACSVEDLQHMLTVSLNGAPRADMELCEGGHTVLPGNRLGQLPPREGEHTSGHARRHPLQVVADTVQLSSSGRRYHRLTYTGKQKRHG